jgi:hypothetical protein
VQANHAFYDRQAQAEPSACAIAGLSFVYERLEYLSQHVGADANSVILCAQHRLVRLRFGRH